RAILAGVILLVCVSVPTYAQAPVPFISLPLVPDARTPGGGDFTLTLNGTGFVSNSVVNWNGVALPTQVVNSSLLKATVPASDIPTAGRAWVTVVSPAPGGGTSNVMFFTITPKTTQAGFALASRVPIPFYPQTLAVGDFNLDGKLDLFVAGLIDYSLS